MRLSTRTCRVEAAGQRRQRGLATAPGREGAADKTGRHVSGPPPRATGANANSSHRSGHPGALRATSPGEEEEEEEEEGGEKDDFALLSSVLGLSGLQCPAS